MAITGSCLCGGVRFEIDRAAGPVEICHCTRCRKTSGAGGLPMVRVRRQDYRLIEGGALIKTYAAPIIRKAPAYHAYFCRACGSPVPPADPIEDELEVPAGIFDDDPGVKPDKHIFVEFLAPWDAITDALPRYTVRAIVKARYGRELPADFKAPTHYDAPQDEGA